MQTDGARLLVVEDDDELAALLCDYLAQHGFQLSRAATGEAGAASIVETRPDLVILDLMLPGMNGLDVCRRVRSEYPGVIVMLTASRSEADHVAGLELGADDFVTKPIEPRVLLARVRAQLRRVGEGRPTPGQGPADGVVRVGRLTLDASTRDVRVGDVEVALTTMEFDVLLMLVQDAGTVVTRDALYTKVAGVAYDGLDRGMDVHVSRLRRKLERGGFDPTRIKSIRGVGYLLACR